MVSLCDFNVQRVNALSPEGSGPSVFHCDKSLYQVFLDAVVES
jgi:hypothetical protein